jgi:hypothetical protein
MEWVMHGMLAGASPSSSRRAATGQLVQHSGRCSSISNPKLFNVRAMYRNADRSSADPDRRTAGEMESPSRTAET